MSAKNSKPSTTTSTTSKPSTGSAIDTKKNRWLRIGPARAPLPELDQLLDLYWGGPERRITGITMRIIAVNAIALIILMAGILYLGQYQNNLIASKLETFNAEVALIAAAIAEGASEPYMQKGRTPYDPATRSQHLNALEARQIARRLAQTMGQRIYLFDEKGELLSDSQILGSGPTAVKIQALTPPPETLFTIRVLKSMVSFVLSLLPERRELPPFPAIESGDIADFPGGRDALQGRVTMAAWQGTNGGIFLSATAPLTKDGNILGAAMLTRPGHEIESSLAEVWLNIMISFILTLVITTLLSIYLSGVIARPLRKLANAAEGVRKGKLDYNDIPDLSQRHDEIGELSIALRQMTHALGERMDTIERFAADVAHELKNPLTSMRSALETALRVKNKEDRDKMMAIIEHDIERLDRLITDISRASRLDAELSRERFESIDLRALLEKLVENYRDPLSRNTQAGNRSGVTARVNNVSIVFEDTEGLPVHVWGLEGRLEQVFQNIITNALSFAPPGSQIGIHVQSRHRRVRITIEDQGPGIPPGKLETIFERFYSERPGHESFGRHSGLGLSICRQIVEALGGEVFAENVTDADGNITGARFTVVLGLS